ncbi:glycosyltransferase family 4 protein [Coralliovum pocilloporae]|uniref:glycosyltransferase family 4 protein n=1 Tax=Coralliovum pocilloporae TaxID=3066369 RepID=UPI00330712B7
MKRIAVVVKGYPRLSETFIAQELLGLEQRGFKLLIVSLRHPTDPAIHDLHREIKADVLYLPEYLKDDPKRVRAARKWAEAQPGYKALEKVFQEDLSRDKTANRWRRLGQACVLAHELPEDIEWIYTHFLHTPCSVGRYAAMLRGMQWSFAAHAKDIWTSPEWELREKIQDCAWGVTCTQVNTDYLNSLADRPDKVELVYHGLELDRFPDPNIRPQKNAADTNEPFRILSVGRAVEKKGYDDLLRALAKLPGNLNWHFDHIGGGALKDKLKAQAEKLGIDQNITWHGSKDRDFVIDSCRQADLFVLPSRIIKNGDRDGLPNVLMEAQAVGLCCLSTSVSAIPELIIDGETGRLCPERDSKALAETMEELMTDPKIRIRLGLAGSARLRQSFASTPNLDRLTQKFEASLAEVRNGRLKSA